MIDLIRGDDAVRDVTVTSGGSPVSLADAQSVRFTAKYSLADADADAPIRKEVGDGLEVDITDTNVAHITFAAADTHDMAAPAVLVCDVEVRDVEGLIRTVWAGLLRVLPDVTLESPGS